MISGEKRPEDLVPLGSWRGTQCPGMPSVGSWCPLDTGRGRCGVRVCVCLCALHSSHHCAIALCPGPPICICPGINALKTEKGLALQDILTEVHTFSYQIDFPPQQRIYLLQQMAEIEYVSPLCVMMSFGRLVAALLAAGGPLGC